MKTPPGGGISEAGKIEGDYRELRKCVVVPDIGEGLLYTAEAVDEKNELVSPVPPCQGDIMLSSREGEGDMTGFHGAPEFYPAYAIASISTRAPRGRFATA